MPDSMPNSVSDRLLDTLPDRMPENMPDRMPDKMPDRMPEDMPDRMTDSMPDKMPEDMPDRMPGRCQVGITRSKVILCVFFWGWSCCSSSLEFHLVRFFRAG